MLSYFKRCLIWMSLWQAKSSLRLRGMRMMLEARQRAAIAAAVAGQALHATKLRYCWQIPLGIAPILQWLPSKLFISLKGSEAEAKENAERELDPSRSIQQKNGNAVLSHQPASSSTQGTEDVAEGSQSLTRLKSAIKAPLTTTPSWSVWISSASDSLQQQE